MESKKKDGDLPSEPDPGSPTSTTLKKKSNNNAAATAAASMAESRSTSFCNYGSMSSIANISQDHLFLILLLLPIDSILSFSMTCRRFRSFTCSDSLWESICKRDLGQNSVEAIKSAAADSKHHRHHHHHHHHHLLPWMELYRQVYQLDCVSCYKLSDHNPDADGVLPSPRASHSLNFVSGCLVLFGGGCEGGRHLDDTWVAYIGNEVKRTLEWKKINSGTPSGRFGHSGVVVGDSIVVFGGINDRGVRQNDTWIGQVVFHDTFGITMSWRRLDVGSTAPPPRGAHAGCCIDDRRMLIHGGMGFSGLRLADTWVLELSDNLLFGTWHEIGTHPSPPARSGHTLTYIGKNQTVLFGGRGSGYEVLNDVWLFDLSEDRLRCLQLLFEPQNIPQGAALPRVGHSATLILGGRRLLIYGGEDLQRRKNDDFWVLDIGSIPSVRMDPMIVAQPEGGIAAKMWRRIDGIGSGYKPDRRSFHGACADGSGCYLYVLGGMMDGLSMAEPSGLRFDGEVFLVELLVLHL